MRAPIAFLLPFLLLCLSSGCQDGDETDPAASSASEDEQAASTPTRLDLSSPQATYDALVEAIDSNDHAAHWSTISDHVRQWNVSGLALQVAMNHKFADADPAIFGPTGKPDSIMKSNEAFQLVLEKHGLTFEQVDKISHGVGAPYGKAILELVDDQQRFYVDMSKAADISIAKTLLVNQRFPPGDLRDVVINDKMAHALKPGEAGDIFFEQIGTEWRVLGQLESMRSGSTFQH